MNSWNKADICSYLFMKHEPLSDTSFEEVFRFEPNFCKEDLMSMKILDMTPGFGQSVNMLTDNIAYLSFVLPYRERNTFNNEWENETRLKQYIIKHLLYGVERSHFSLDILKNFAQGLYRADASNYRIGNPLIGMSLKDLVAGFDEKKQLGLFSTHPADVIEEIRQMHKRHSSLSAKIKEDALIRDEISHYLSLYMNRAKDTLDVMTSAYFNKKVDRKFLHEMVLSLKGEQSNWDSFTSKSWFRELKELARQKGFFHFEVEFPFLLSGAFDIIFVQPTLSYLWEEDFPVTELTKAFIKRGMHYLKENGIFVILAGNIAEGLAQKLKGSKKYSINARQGLLLLQKTGTV